MSSKSATLWQVFKDGEWYKTFICDRQALAYVQRMGGKPCNVVEVEKDILYRYGSYTFERVQAERYFSSIHEKDPIMPTLAEAVKEAVMNPAKVESLAGEYNPWLVEKASWQKRKLN